MFLYIKIAICLLKEKLFSIYKIRVWLPMVIKLFDIGDFKT